MKPKKRLLLVIQKLVWWAPASHREFEAWEIHISAEIFPNTFFIVYKPNISVYHGGGKRI